METLKDVLTRLLVKPPCRDAGRPASDLRSPKPGSAPAPLDTQPKHQLGKDDGKPLFTAAEAQKVGEYLKSYMEGYCHLRRMEQMLSRPGLSDLEAKQVIKLMNETLTLIQPLGPVVDAAKKYCAKLADLDALCRECLELLRDWEVDLKLDRLQNSIDRCVAALEANSEAHSTEKPIKTLSDFCKLVVQKN